MDQTTGKNLRDARIAKDLSLEEVSEALHIRVSYLQALEANTLEQIPTLTQARGFIRSYGKFLELDVANLFEEQASPEEISPETEESPEVIDEPIGDDGSHTLIFKEIGETLQHRRETLGLSKEDIEAHTHIPSHYVDYIEDGEFDNFPSPAQARGMLNNYLNFLEFKPEDIMSRYAEALQIRLSSRRDQATEEEVALPTTSPPRRGAKVPQWVRMFLSPDLILISMVGIIIIGLTIWGIGRISRTQSEQVPQPTAPSLVEALLPTATNVPTATPTPQTSGDGALLDVDNPEDAATPIPTVQIAPGSSLELFVIVRQRSYLQVTVDGAITFDGRTNPGNNLTFTAADEIRFLTGNAAAIQLYFNDQDQGVLGIFGEVSELIFTKDGIIRPTKVPTATPLATEELTQTPEPEATEEVDLPPEQNTPVP